MRLEGKPIGLCSTVGKQGLSNNNESNDIREKKYDSDAWGGFEPTSVAWLGLLHLTELCCPRVIVVLFVVSDF